MLNIPTHLQAPCLELVSMFRDNGFEIRLVGGAVRDMVLGKTPKDYDFATTATPDEMMEMAMDEDVHFITTGIQHGTLTFVINHIPFEVTTLRKDVETDGRHAEVEFVTDWEVDAARRDFTMNAMSYDLLTGELFDYFHGEEHLEQRYIEFVGDVEMRVQEDYLRILRYFRFMAQLGWSCNDEYFEEIAAHAYGLENVSGERIAVEMYKISICDNARDTFDLMLNWGIFQYIGLENVSYVNTFVQNVPTPIVNIVNYLSLFPNDILRLHKRWKLSSWDLELAYKTCAINVYLMDIKNPKDKDVWIRYILEGKIQLIQYQQIAPSFELPAITAEDIPDFPIRGQDIVDLGFKQGKLIGALMNHCYNEWIQSNYTLTKEQMLKDITNA